jgi:hypothetical protein
VNHSNSSHHHKHGFRRNLHGDKKENTESDYPMLPVFGPFHALIGCDAPLEACYDEVPRDGRNEFWRDGEESIRDDGSPGLE